MLINSEVKIVDFIRCVLSKLFWYGQSLYKVGRIPVMYRDSWEVTSYAVFLKISSALNLLDLTNLSSPGYIGSHESLVRIFIGQYFLQNFVTYTDVVDQGMDIVAALVAAVALLLVIPIHFKNFGLEVSDADVNSQVTFGR